MESIPENPRTRISKLYLLVHPGFTGGPDAEYDLEGPDEVDIRRSKALLNLYLEKIRNLAPTEALVVFGYAEPDLFEKHKTERAFYTQFIAELESFLGDRLIFIHDDVNAFRGPEAFEVVQSTLKERGFFIDRETDTEAFGETAASCVVDCAENFNKSGKFSNKTKVDLRLTNWFEHPSNLALEMLGEIRDRFSRLLFRFGNEDME